MRKLFIAAFALASATAVATAQPAERPHPEHDSGDHGDPNLGGVHDEKAGTHTGTHESQAGAHGAEHGGGHGDPTEHFNFLGYERGKLFDYKKKDAFGGPFGDGVMVDPKTGAQVKSEEAGSPPFVLMLLNFGLLLVILAKYGGPAARKLAQDRHDQIKTALDEAAKLRDEAQKKLSEYEARISGLDAEVKKLVEGIRADAEADKARILESAAKQSAQMKKDAEARIAAEIDIARAALAKEVAVAATSATEKLLREKVTGDDQTKLVTTFISSVQAQPAATRGAR